MQIRDLQETEDSSQRSGHDDPTKEPSVIKFDEEAAKQWLANGAQPTDTFVAKLLKVAGIEK